MCSCDQALDLISAQLDGPLTAAEAAELSAHLAHCRACRALSDELSALHRAMPTLTEEVPAGFHTRAMAALRAEQIIPFPAQKHKNIWKSWGAMAAVFALLVVGGGTALRLQNTGHEAAPVAAPPPVTAPEQTPAENGEKRLYGSTGVQEDILPAATAPLPLQAPAPSTAPVEATPPMQRSANGAAAPTQAAPPVMQVASNSAAEALPTASPSPSPEPGGSYSNATSVAAQTPNTVLSPETAGVAVAARAYPSVPVERSTAEDGSFLGLTLTPADGGALSLVYLGISKNDAYYEFSLRPEGSDEEWNRYALSRSGTTYLVLWYTGTDEGPRDNSAAYEQAVAH